MVPASGPGTTEGGGLAGGGASPADAAAEVAKCVPRLAEEAALLRSWLERELPQEENSLGRRTLTVVENSLVSGLFVLFLRQGFAEFFHDAGDEEGGDPRSRAEAKGLAMRRAAIVFAIEASLDRQRSALVAAGGKGESSAIALDVVKCCAGRAGGGGAPLRACRAGRGTGKRVGLRVARVAAGGGTRGIPRRRRESLSAFPQRERRTAPTPRQGHWTIRNSWSTSRASSLPCSAGTFQRRRGRAGYHRRGWACGWRRRSAASGEKAGSLFPRTLRFPSPRSSARKAAWPARRISSPRQPTAISPTWRQLAGSMGLRQCLPYLENQAAQLARIQVRQGPGGVTLLALPTAAMAMSDDFAENFTLEQAIQQAQEQSPATGSPAACRGGLLAREGHRAGRLFALRPATAHASRRAGRRGGGPAALAAKGPSLPQPEGPLAAERGGGNPQCLGNRHRAQGGRCAPWKGPPRRPPPHPFLEAPQGRAGLRHLSLRVDPHARAGTAAWPISCGGRTRGWRPTCGRRTRGRNNRRYQPCNARSRA